MRNQQTNGFRDREISMFPALVIVVLVLFFLLFYYYLLPFILPIFAVFYMKKGNLVRAIQIYDKILRLAPNMGKAWYVRGLLLKRTGQPDEALRNFDCATRLSPRHSEAAAEAVMVLMELGRYQEALKRINQIISTHNCPINSVLTRSSIQIQLQNFPEAENDCNWVIDHDYDGTASAGAVNNRGLARLGMKNLEAALADFELALLLDSRLTITQAHIAGCWLRQGDFKNTVQLCDRILKKDPDCEAALYYRGLAHQRMGNSELAAQDLNRAKESGYTDDLIER